MRFNVNIDLENENIPKDKNRMFLSFLKHYLSENNKDVFKENYGEGITSRKSFAMSSYLPGAKFNKDTITIPSKKIILTISTSELELGIELFNALLGNIYKTYKYKDIVLKHSSVKLVKEKVITNNCEIFKAISPIVIREHFEETNKNWFYSFDEEMGKKLFLENLKHQLEYEFPESKYDLDDIKVEILNNKRVIVRNYSIDVLSNLAVLKIEAKPYILNHIYKAGVGSLKSSGFGLLNIV